MIVMQPVEQTGWVSKELEALWCCKAFKNTHNEREHTNDSSGISRSIIIMTAFGSGYSRLTFGVILSLIVLFDFRFDF